MYNSRILICPDGLFINTDMLFYFGSINGVPEALLICQVDGIKLRRAKSEKGVFIRIEDAIDLSLRESHKKGPYGRFRQELATEFHRWKSEFERGVTAFSLSDILILQLEVYLSNAEAGKFSRQALDIVRSTRPDLFVTKATITDKRVRAESCSLVYFIKGLESGNIKIGYAGNPDSRRKGLQTGSSEELSLLKTIDGGAALEAELKSRFAHLKIRGEWFRPEADLINFIDTL